MFLLYQYTPKKIPKAKGHVILLSGEYLEALSPKAFGKEFLLRDHAVSSTNFYPTQIIQGVKRMIRTNEKKQNAQLIKSLTMKGSGDLEVVIRGGATEAN